MLFNEITMMFVMTTYTFSAQEIGLVFEIPLLLAVISHDTRIVTLDTDTLI